MAVDIFPSERFNLKEYNNVTTLMLRNTVVVRLECEERKCDFLEL
jgi:hypothetical protein